MTIELNGSSKPPQLPNREELTKSNHNSTITHNQFLTHILKLPHPIKKFVLAGLSDRQLQAIKIVLFKGTNIDETYKSTFPILTSMCSGIIENRKKQLLENLLKAHPDWKSAVDTWQNVSLDDKIWLLRLYDYQNHEYFGYHYSIREVRDLHDLRYLGTAVMPTKDSVKLLELANRQKISQFFASISSIRCIVSTFSSYPEGICYLNQITAFKDQSGQLTVPPNLKHCVKLTKIEIS